VATIFTFHTQWTCGIPSYPGLVNVEFLDQFIYSGFDDVAPIVIRLPVSTIIDKRFSPCGSNPIFPSIFAPSISPNEKQATNVLNPALTTPETSEDGHNLGVAVA
jgi:hypothetical protein